MPQIKKKLFSDYDQQSWKNGGGVTYEICVLPQKELFYFRLSMATIAQSGPFSFFEGYKRILVPLSGEISLRHDEQSKTQLKIMEPYAFDGAVPTYAFIDQGTAHDFNVIYDPEKVLVDLQVVNLHQPQNIPLSCEQIYVFCAAGEVVISALGRTRLAQNDLGEVQRTADNQTITLSAGDNSKAVAILVSLSYPKSF